MTHPHGLGRIEHPDTPRAARLHPITAHPDYKLSTRQRRWWWEGGAWLDQGQTGTCVGNANAHRYADGPVPHSGIDEAWARKLYVDASGDTTLQQGTSELSAARVLLDRGEIDSFHWVTGPDEMRNTILEVGSLCVGTWWYNSMFYPTQDDHGNWWVKVDHGSGRAGGHEYVINGIRLDVAYGRPFYRLKNSWGRSWGNGGTVRIACDDLHQLIFSEGGDACLLSEVA